MKIVIDIPDEDIDAIKYLQKNGFASRHELAILNGIPLPKGHGDDVVNRQAVLNTLDKMDKALDVDRTVENYKELLKECYEVLPAITPQQAQWIPIKLREATEEEKEICRGLYGYEIEQTYDCKLPEHGQDVLITTCYGDVVIDTFYNDEGSYFETYCDDDDVVAWQPLPKPYKKEI